MEEGREKTRPSWELPGPGMKRKHSSTDLSDAYKDRTLGQVAEPQSSNLYNGGIMQASIS